MCREEPVHEPHHEAGESTEDMELDLENFKYRDPLYGLDDTTGFQILQWSIEEGLRQGRLAGSKYLDEDNPLRIVAPPSIRASAIGEPGAKSRVVTVGEDWLTQILSPWAHHWIGIIRHHPSAKTGLTRGWQLFEWCKSLRNTKPVPDQKTYFLSSDLTAATDHCEHKSSQAMLEGFMEGVGMVHSTYSTLCAELLCSSRIYEGPIDRFVDGKTRQGVLMGDPGAKLVLTLHNLCAEYESRIRYVCKAIDMSDHDFLYMIRKSRGPPALSWVHFTCSGDDHFGQGPKCYLSCITSTHSKNGMLVSKSQNFLSPRGGFYCEEILCTVGLRSDQIWGVDSPFGRRDYLTHPHVDAMKVRLFSPCSKEHEGKDEPNPAIGKARQAHGMLAWLGGGWELAVPFFSARWEQRMSGFLPDDLSSRYLPIKLGGLEVPAYHRSFSELVDIILQIRPEKMEAIFSVMNGVADPITARVLATFATNSRARGVSTDLIQSQIEEVLGNAELVRGLDDDGLLLASGVSETAWKDMRYRDKCEHAKRLGLITVSEAINLIDRPYIFRDLLFPEISIRHGIDPYRSNQYTSMPWSVREEVLLHNIEENTLPAPQGVPVDRQIQLIDKIAEWCKSNASLDIPQNNYWLPRDVVVHETLATLRTPL